MSVQMMLLGGLQLLFACFFCGVAQSNVITVENARICIT